MKSELDSKRIRNIYIMLIAILCLTIISSTAILSYVFVHWNDSKKNNNLNIDDYDVSEFTEITYDDFMNKFSSNEQSLIYIGRSTCVHCINFIPTLKEAQNKYNYTTYYLDLSKLTEDEIDNIKKLNKFLDKNFGMTPMIIVVKDGKLLPSNEQEGWIGEANLDDFSNFLENLEYKKKD